MIRLDFQVRGDDTSRVVGSDFTDFYTLRVMQDKDVATFFFDKKEDILDFKNAVMHAIDNMELIL